MTDAWATTVVVPCFNEAERIDEEDFLAVSKRTGIRLLFVDDGSADETLVVLERMAKASTSVEVFKLDVNMGKAEAVRRGLLLAMRRGASVVGYYDADLATPTSELERLIRAMDQRPELAAAFGCRVGRLGSVIKRSLTRHYLGRLYATLASFALGTVVYDTQCGAKLFRVTPSLVTALAQPFRSAWSFDVELLDRLLRGSANAPAVSPNAFLEMPLESWRDVEGSKMNAAQAFSAFVDLVLMANTRRRRNARAWRSGEERPAALVQPTAVAPGTPDRLSRVSAGTPVAAEGDRQLLGGVASPVSDWEAG